MKKINVLILILSIFVLSNCSKEPTPVKNFEIKTSIDRLDNNSVRKENINGVDILNFL